VTAVRPLSGQAAPFARVTEAQAKAALEAANAAAKGNYDTLMSTFEKELKKVAPDYDNNGFKVYDRAELQVTLFGPAQMLVASARENLKNNGAIGTPGWNGMMTVYVAPQNLDSPDIVKVIATRDGKPIEAKATDLKETEMSMSGDPSHSAVKKTVHEGAALFPTDGFNPGGKVVVTATSTTGRNYSRELADRDLKKLQ
jgi:hypothetical protein